MSTIKELLAGKGCNLLSVGPDATVLDAALLMNEHKVGSVVVMEAGDVRGMFTERDILRRIVAARLDPCQTRVRDVMTAEVIYCQLSTTIEEARGVMKNRRIRHLPVLGDDGRMCGLISIGDLNAFEANNQEKTIHLLHEYIHGQT